MLTDQFLLIDVRKRRVIMFDQRIDTGPPDIAIGIDEVTKYFLDRPIIRFRRPVLPRLRNQRRAS